MDILEEFSCSYFLDNEQLERLKAILQAEEKMQNERRGIVKGALTLGGVFNTMMIQGSAFLINDRLTRQEEQLGIIDHKEAERRRKEYKPKEQAFEELEDLEE